MFWLLSAFFFGVGCACILIYLFLISLRTNYKWSTLITKHKEVWKIIIISEILFFTKIDISKNDMPTPYSIVNNHLIFFQLRALNVWKRNRWRINDIYPPIGRNKRTTNDNYSMIGFASSIQNLVLLFYYHSHYRWCMLQSLNNLVITNT